MLHAGIPIKTNERHLALRHGTTLPPDSPGALRTGFRHSL
jgi:hypothetical protein